MDARTSRLQAIYDEFETRAAPFKAGKVCEKGCAYCCSAAGAIDITTLEGLAIITAIRNLTRPRQAAVKKTLAFDMKQREQGRISACPFLLKNNTCMIYAARPFACRRIYSIEVCGQNQPPRLNRQVMAIGDQTISALQQLDDTGYSGHISYILAMLESPGFLSTYLAGAFKPETISHFGRSHRIVINRMVARAKAVKA